LSKPQNRLLADTFYKAGLIESWGRGTIKIVDDCIRSGLKEPEFIVNEHFFSILFHRTIDNEVDKPTDKPTDKLSINQVKILQIISANPYITSKEIAVALEIRPDSIRVNISKLKDKGLLERIGPAKGGYWVVL
jgi:ATP-dependent DNA helicase RecG